MDRVSRGWRGGRAQGRETRDGARRRGDQRRALCSAKLQRAIPAGTREQQRCGAVTTEASSVLVSLQAFRFGFWTPGTQSDCKNKRASEVPLRGIRVCAPPRTTPLACAPGACRCVLPIAALCCSWSRSAPCPACRPAPPLRLLDHFLPLHAPCSILSYSVSQLSRVASLCCLRCACFLAPRHPPLLSLF